MKNILIIFMVFYLVIFSVSGQDNILRFEVQQAKNANVHFDNVAFSVVGADSRVFNNFIDSNEVFFFGNISLDVKNNNTKAMDLTIPLNNKNMILELVEVPEYFYDYEVIIGDNGERRTANLNIKHYRGVVKDEVNSLVAITVYNNEIMGLVCTDEGNFNIAKDSLSGKHLFYNDKNLKNKTYPTCAMADDLSVPYDSITLFGQRDNLNKSLTMGRSPIINKNVRFYVETRNDIYRKLGRDLDAVEAFIAGLFNQVAVLYLNEDIWTTISCLCMWHGGDPYTTTDIEKLLTQFQNKNTSINGDLGILLTFKNLGGGLAAGFNGLCNSSASAKLAVAEIDKGYNTVPEYSYSVEVVTHELGHLLGSRHTHACVWNGNNTAIDACPNGVEGSCALPNPLYPSNGGTIMSYCHLQSVGINFNLGFGEQPGNVIRANVRNANCLPTCDVDFINQTVTVSTTVTGCNDINIQNVTVTNNSKLKLNPPNEVIINGSFEIQSGSELEIK